MFRRNGPVIKSVESVLRPEESLWWEIFVEEVGFEPGAKEWGVMDGDSGDLTQWEDVAGVWTGRWETDRDRSTDLDEIDGEHYGVDSKDKVRHIERNDQLYVTRMMLAAEQKWRQMKNQCCETVEKRWGYADMKVMWLWGERSLYSMRSVVLSQWREREIGVIWHDLRALTAAWAWEFWICQRRVIWDFIRL